MERIFSTAEVSRMWNVSESTIKRWADSGDLACVKTPGGHRKFRLEALLAFQQQNGFTSTGWLESFPHLPPEPTSATIPEADTKEAFPAVFSLQLETAISSRNPEELQQLYFEAAIKGEEAQVREIFHRAYLRGFSPLEFKETIVKPVLHRVGNLWQKGDLSVFEEHLASQVTLAAGNRLHGQVPGKTGNGLTAVCGCPEGDWHEIPLHWLAQTLESEGWKVIVTGPNTPIFSFTEAIRQFRPELLCISATIVSNLERLRRDYSECWPVAQKWGTRIMIGGAAFTSPDIRAQFPHDFFGESFVELVEYLRITFPPQNHL
ncbi:MAG: cobalamin-dependent protein [Blastocatellia bacterium]|nr:cobalamin-dependent protein [Blastocatellia bacterium]